MNGGDRKCGSQIVPPVAAIAALLTASACAGWRDGGGPDRIGQDQRTLRDYGSDYTVQGALLGAGVGAAAGGTAG
jgi:hypothetical protein